MINGHHYYFFRLDHFDPDIAPEYRIARSFVDLSQRLGGSYLAQFRMIAQLSEVTPEHLSAVIDFLSQKFS